MPAPTTSNPIRLVIADVDGTLVTQEKILTERAIQSVFRLRTAGIKFAVTSGRPPQGMAMLIDPLKIDQPVAAFNGGVIVKPDLSTIVRQNFLPRAMVEKVIKIILDHKLDVWVYTGRDWYVRDVNAPHVAREQWTVKFAPKVVPNFDGVLENVAKVVASATTSPPCSAAKKTLRTPAATRPPPLALSRTISTSPTPKPTKAK